MGDILKPLLPRALAAVIFFAPAGAAAGEYPEKPVRIIVPSAPGGGTDTTMRIISPKLGEVLGQRVILDNRPGQSGNIGVEIASRATPDGYTLAAMIASNASNPAVMKSVPYNLERDFAPIARIVTMPNVLTVHPSLPVTSVKELVAFARARPGQIYYGSPGFGSTAHLAMELLTTMSKIRMMHVPYKSGGAVFIAVQSGETPIFDARLVTLCAGPGHFLRVPGHFLRSTDLSLITRDGHRFGPSHGDSPGESV